MSRAGEQTGAFAELARAAVAVYEAHGVLIAPVAAAFLFLPGLAAGVLMGAMGVGPDSPLRLLALAPVLLLGAAGQAAIAMIAMGAAGRTVSATLAEAWSQAGAVLLVSFLTGVLVVLGLLALIAPGLYLLTRLAGAMPAMLAERLSPMTALGRAWELSRGREWRVFGFMALLVLVTAVALFLSALVGVGLEAAAERAGVVAMGRFAARALVGWVEASASAAIVIAQVCVYRWLRREARVG